MFSRANFETYVTDADGLTVDLIIWRRYRRQTPGLVEAVLDMNAGVADLGPLLPRGTMLKIPIDQPSMQTQATLIRLW